MPHDPAPASRSDDVDGDPLAGIEFARKDPSGLADRLFVYRGWILIAVTAVLIAVTWPIEASLVEVGVALPIIVFGIWMRIWSRRHFTSGSNTRAVRAKRLIVTGPYRFSRNPLYVGNIAVAAGLVLAYAGTWAAVGVALALFVMYEGVLRSEERILLQGHGDDYAAYCRRVSRWFSNPWRHERLSDAPPRATWPRAIRKEKERLVFAHLGWLVALLVAVLH